MAVPDRYIIWDFDGTIAFREGLWSQAVVDVVNRNFPEAKPQLSRSKPCTR